MFNFFRRKKKALPEPVRETVKGVMTIYCGPELTDDELNEIISKDLVLLDSERHVLIPTEDQIRYNFPGADFDIAALTRQIEDKIPPHIYDEIAGYKKCVVSLYSDGSHILYDAEKLTMRQISNNILIQGVFLRGPVERCQRIGPKWETSDILFDDQMRDAADQAKKLIGDLIMKGYPESIILNWIKESVKISRLHITTRFKIFLSDYDNIEVKMSPLAKAVFFLFLRHPEGILLSELPQYKDELLKIYKKITVTDDQQKIVESIDLLTDPSDNSIHEKCALVKRAFLTNICDTIAQNYYIKGKQGAPKLISLDRELVTWEQEIL